MYMYVHINYRYSFYKDLTDDCSHEIDSINNLVFFHNLLTYIYNINIYIYIYIYILYIIYILYYVYSATQISAVTQQTVYEHIAAADSFYFKKNSSVLLVHEQQASQK